MAIVTSKFRTQAASSFATAFGTNNIYLMLGRPQPWDDALSPNWQTQASGAVTDSNPPNPADNDKNIFAFWREAMAAVRITGSDVRLATTKNTWIPNIRYDMYRDDINSAQATSTGKYSLGDSNMIVYVTSTGAVYKCLYNGTNAAFTTGILSTVQPSALTAAPETTSDGYKWKYMYTLTASDADFVTANYIPVPNFGSSVSSINGIDVILVINSGTAYAAAPTVTIYGDGTGATATAITSAGVVTGITVNNVGSGYTWAKVTLTGGSPTSQASATAIIAPAGGHGSNFIAECYAKNVMIAATVSGYQANDIPVNQDFRSIGIVSNPTVYVTSAVTSAGTSISLTTALAMRTLQMTSGATTAPANDIVISNASGAQGLAVYQSSGTVLLNYIQPVKTDSSTLTAAESARIDTVGTKQLLEFANGNTITGANYSYAVSSVTAVTPEIQPYSGNFLYLDYRQPVTRSAGQNEKINIVINF